VIRFCNPLPGFYPTGKASLFGEPRTGHTHGGWDENAPTGTPVRAAAQGRVSKAGDSGDIAGLAVSLSHGQNWTSFYCHLDQVLCAPGDTVRAGQIIGTVGATGNAEAPHLHFQLTLCGVNQDPALLLYPECGPDVAWVQQRLNAHRQKVTVDGWYGPKTAQAVVNVQQLWGLDPTGTVSPLTVSVLKGKPKSLPKHPPEVERWRSLVDTWWVLNSQPLDYVLLILWAESRGNPAAVNPESGASGLFQHLPQYWQYRSEAAGFPGADIFDPEANVATAAWLWTVQGWEAWEAALTYPLASWSPSWRWLGDRYGTP
jgi:murein DD-endopeptidase MepM/ murein hydrolase activator NlpD